MPLNRDGAKRAEGYGYYSSYGSDAADVLSYISSDLPQVSQFEPGPYEGAAFKVTIIIEEL